MPILSQNTRSGRSNSSSGRNQKVKFEFKGQMERHNEQSIKNALNVGSKGKGRENSQFPHGAKPGRYTAIPHGNNTTKEVMAITALSGRAHAAHDEAYQKQQTAAAGSA